MDIKNVAMRLAIVWACLFSLNSLGTCIMVGLGNARWAEMALQAKFVLIIGIWVNWSGTMMAYLSKAMHRLELGGSIPTNGDTSLLTKEAATKTPTVMKTAIGIIAVGWIILIFGCSSFSNNLFRSEQALSGVAATAYISYTNGLADGIIHPSADESNAVKTARIKLAASLLTVEQWRLAFETNSAVKPQAQAALDALVSNSSNVVYLINLLKSK